MSHVLHRHQRPCHPERSEGPLHFLSGWYKCIGPFGKLRAGSSRKERAQDDKENFGMGVR